jgi:hypothetical protein
LRLDFVACTVRAEIVKGLEDGTDAPKTLVQDASYWEIPIARIDVDNGYSTITAAEIIDDRFYANLPPVVAAELANNGGSEIDVGTVVVYDSGIDKGVDTSRVAATGKIARVGAVQLRVTGTVARGNRLRQSSTPGVAEVGFPGSFCTALTPNASGDGVIWVQLDLPARYDISCSAERTSNLDTGNGGTWRALTLPTNTYDPWSMQDPVNTERFTNQRSGMYVIHGRGTPHAYNSVYASQWRVLLNSTTQITGGVVADSSDQASKTILYYLQAGDTLDLQMYFSASYEIQWQGAMAVSFVGD